MSENNTCDKPCVTCPWLKANQTKEAVAQSPLDGRMIRWFDPRNLRNHWRHVADGGMMPCHATDRNAPLYGGKPTAAEQGRVCVGLTILVHREVHHFMVAGTNFEQYRLARGIRMTLLGLASWASRLCYQGAVLEVGREKLTIPTISDDARVQTPWADDIQRKRRSA